VVIHCRNSTDQARALADEANRRRAQSACVVACPVESIDAPERITAAALEHFGRLDLLINNASSFFPTDVTTSDRRQWDELMNSNLRGPWFLSAAAAEPLGESGGAIVNMVDIHGLVPLAGHGIYSQAKAGLIMQTRALARDLAPAVRVNGVAPGTILWPEGKGQDSSEGQAAILQKVPLGRQGSPEDIAGAVAFLGLDAPYITGQILAVDGGRLLNM